MGETRQRILLMLAVLFLPNPGSAQSPAARTAFTPTPVAEAAWARKVTGQQGILANQPCRVCFIGDSLTECWNYSGRATWELEFAPLRSINLGITGDRTEHVLNRIHRFQFHRANPKVIVLLMGTNNLGMDPPDSAEDVAKAIKAGVDTLHAKVPQATIVLLTIPPSGDEPESPLRRRIKLTNDLLTRQPWPAHVRLLPIYEAMVDAQDRWRQGYTIDGTHFSETGYSKLGELIAPVVKKLLIDG
jgi:lysophospholipase L1-like esterase